MYLNGKILFTQSSAMVIVMVTVNDRHRNQGEKHIQASVILIKYPSNIKKYNSCLEI